MTQPPTAPSATSDRDARPAAASRDGRRQGNGRARRKASPAPGQDRLDSEEAVTRPAIEARDPAATAHAHEGLEEHESAFAEIDGLLVTIETTRGDVRAGAGGASPA